jgi:hypothetical protein
MAVVDGGDSARRPLRLCPAPFLCGASFRKARAFGWKCSTPPRRAAQERRAMQAMRDAGFDVVYFGNAKERSDSSVVLVRSGHPQWAALAAKTLQGARVESKPDTSRYLDLTILIGSRWVPPPDLFHP